MINKILFTIIVLAIASVLFGLGLMCFAAAYQMAKGVPL